MRWLGVINLTWGNLQIAKHKSGKRLFSSAEWFVLWDLSEFSGKLFTPSHLTHNLFFYFQPRRHFDLVTFHSREYSSPFSLSYQIHVSRSWQTNRRGRTRTSGDDPGSSHKSLYGSTKSCQMKVESRTLSRIATVPSWTFAKTSAHAMHKNRTWTSPRSTSRPSLTKTRP